MKNPDDALVALAKRARNGDGEAFAELFNAVHQPVLNYVYRIVSDRQVAEDVTQDAFIRAHERLPQLGPPWDFKSWVFRIAGNMALDHLRANKRFVDVEEPGEMSGPPTTRRPAEKGVQRAEMRRDVEATLVLLPVAFRQALVLREMNGLSYQEVAQVMDVSYDNARQIVHRARLQFREAHGMRMMARSGAARCQVLDDLISAYLDDELSAARRRAIEEHIAGCPDCQETERDLQKVAGLVAGVVPILPSPGWAQSVLDQLGVSGAGQGAGAGDGGTGQGSPDAGQGAVAGGGGAAGGLPGGPAAKWVLGLGAAVLAAGAVFTAGAFALGFFHPSNDLPPAAAIEATVEQAVADSPLPTPTLTATSPAAPPAPPPPAPVMDITPTPTPTATLGPPFVIASMNANCRSGPGSVYDVVSFLLQDERASVSGRDGASTWWWIERLDGFGRCWVWDNLVTREGDFSQVPVVPAPPTPTPPDTEPPAISIEHSPQGGGHPMTNEPVSFIANASDASGVAWIEIYVQAPGEKQPTLVKRCEQAVNCTYRGGPYTAGRGSYYARAADPSGNTAQSATQSFDVTWYIGLLIPRFTAS